MSAFVSSCRYNPTLGGTTDWTFSSAVLGYNTPALAGIVNAKTYSYRAESADLSQWEEGTGTYNTSTGVHARTVVLYNSSGTGTGPGQSGAGTKISFSTVPQVAIVALAEDLPALSEANSFGGTITAPGYIVKGTVALASWVNALGSNLLQVFHDGSTSTINDIIGSRIFFNLAGVSALDIGSGFIDIYGSTSGRTRVSSANVAGTSNWIIPATSDTFLGTSALDTDTALAANSDSKIATQKATKAYVDAQIPAQIAALDVEVFKGAIDCSANPNYPAADAGNVYRVSVAGKIGGASGPNVEINDRLECFVDSTASGNHATVGANWMIAQTNIDGAVTGPASATSGNAASFNGTSGKIVQDSGKALPSGVITGTTDTQTLTNKTLDATNTVTLKDTLFTLQDDGDVTKQARFQLSGIATGTLRTFTVPDANTTLVGTDTTQTLSNKTMVAPVLGNASATSLNVTVAPGTAWGFDAQGVTIAVAGSSNALLADGAGFIILVDSSSTGNTGLYLTGGSAAALIGQTGGGTPFVTPTTTPAANKYCVAWDGTHYRIYNGRATSVTFYVFMGRARPTV